MLDLRGVVSYTDYFVICSGNTERQTKAIHDAIHQELKDDDGLLRAAPRASARRAGSCSTTSTASSTSSRRPRATTTASSTSGARRRLAPWASARTLKLDRSRSIDRGRPCAPPCCHSQTSFRAANSACSAPSRRCSSGRSSSPSSPPRSGRQRAPEARRRTGRSGTGRPRSSMCWRRGWSRCERYASGTRGRLGGDRARARALHGREPVVVLLVRDPGRATVPLGVRPALAFALPAELPGGRADRARGSPGDARGGLAGRDRRGPWHGRARRRDRLRQGA